MERNYAAVSLFVFGSVSLGGKEIEVCLLRIFTLTASRNEFSLEKLPLPDGLMFVTHEPPRALWAHQVNGSEKAIFTVGRPRTSPKVDSINHRNQSM